MGAPDCARLWLVGWCLSVFFKIEIPLHFFLFTKVTCSKRKKKCTRSEQKQKERWQPLGDWCALRPGLGCGVCRPVCPCLPGDLLSACGSPCPVRVCDIAVWSGEEASGGRQGPAVIEGLLLTGLAPPSLWGEMPGGDWPLGLVPRVYSSAGNDGISSLCPLPRRVQGFGQAALSVLPP